MLPPSAGEDVLDEAPANQGRAISKWGKMTRSTRLTLIKELEKARNTRVLCYVTSTRPGFEVQMAMDTVRLIYDHLVKIGDGAKGDKPPNIDLFIHSNGGDGTVPWRLVTLIREYTKRFSVLVPHRAFSAATLTALGANEIVMHPMGMLGPTDATVTNSFNPLDPTSQQRIGISVEDVTAYFSLIKDDVGIHHEDQLVTAFNILAEKVHPIALGNVKRHISQSRMMARKLLGLHMNHDEHGHRVSNIVENLTSKSFFHGHPINRNEARDQIGLNTVKNADALTERLMWELYLEYEKELQMDTPFDAGAEFLTEFPSLEPEKFATTKKKKIKLMYIESTDMSDYLSMSYELIGHKLPDQRLAVNVLTSDRAWTKE